MNFIRHQKDIKKLLTTRGGKQYSGCYIYSRDEYDKTHKIGMSQAGLVDRLMHAKSCYPFKSEFWLEYIIISLDGHYTKNKTSNTVHIETALHNESKHISTVKMQEGTVKEQGKRPREYRILSDNTEMHSLLKKTLNKHRNKWDYLIVFSTSGWHIIANDRIVKIPITSMDNLKSKKNANKTPTVHSLPLNKTEIVLPKNLKPGDVVEKSDNWSKFEVVEMISKNRILARFGRNIGKYPIGKKEKLYDIYL